MSKLAAIRPAQVTRILLMLGVALVLSGCTRGMSDLRDWVDQEKHKKGAPIPALPVIKTFETFQYADQDKRDPFSPSTAELQQGNANAGPRPDENRSKEPLEMFALDSLKMVGTVGTGAGMEVLVKDPGGVIHRVHRNEYMGQNYGRVTAIGEDHIDLVELVSNGNGGWMERPASIALGEK
ncbi:fimbrial protein [Dyella jiangningensis]|uniref:pilus assembly protein PilP n=1 Tax=Dyella jiangningensis TaxID=1379159 RepID=UPI00045628B0|nr:pilus assembly protein PilP [Dyella jiangningensis]AHX11883.1 fimbrial protein [Dyella jiangningensis]AHX15830.1 fimbrial protein [Dyella jiangningensis]MDG2539243.1 pilus assembly protein PilP [Dyella jiangningensis]